MILIQIFFLKSIVILILDIEICIVKLMQSLTLMILDALYFCQGGICSRLPAF